jgi:hypothetical protein
VASTKGPLSVPVEPALDFNTTPDRAVPRSRQPTRKRGKRRLATWIALMGIAALGVALMVWGGKWLRDFLTTGGTEEDAAPAVSAFNSRFVLPGKPWTRDKNLQMGLHVHLGMRSSATSNSLGLFFKDYKTRLPSDAELLDEALGKLRSYFRGLEWELKPKDERTELAGHPAQVLEFQGEDPEQVTMNGECRMLAFRGYGYWFFTWAPLGELEKDGEAIRAGWTELRQRFSLLDGRKGWKEKPPETDIVRGKKAKYQLVFIKGLWTRETAADEDARVEVMLKGHEPDSERKPLAGKDATVQVLVLPKQADLKGAMAAARDYVKQRETKLYERTTLEPIKDKNGDFDRDAAIGAEPGHLSKLHVKNTEDLERFLLLAVVNRPEGVVVLIGDCLWERRDFWDQEFMALLKNFKVKAR